MISVHQHTLMEALRELDEAVTALHAKAENTSLMKAQLEDLINEKNKTQKAIDQILLDLNEIIAVLETLSHEELDE